jgi:hypothetical protein
MDRGHCRSGAKRPVRTYLAGDGGRGGDPYWRQGALVSPEVALVVRFGCSWFVADAEGEESGKGLLILGESLLRNEPYSYDGEGILRFGCRCGSFGTRGRMEVKIITQNFCSCKPVKSIIWLQGD